MAEPLRSAYVSGAISADASPKVLHAVQDALVALSESMPFAQDDVRIGREQYARCAEANATETEAGRKIFELEMHGEPAPYLTRLSPEPSRRLFPHRTRDQLSDAGRNAVSDWLKEARLACWLP